MEGLVGKAKGTLLTTIGLINGSFPRILRTADGAKFPDSVTERRVSEQGLSRKTATNEGEVVVSQSSVFESSNVADSEYVAADETVSEDTSRTQKSVPIDLLIESVTPPTHSQAALGKLAKFLEEEKGKNPDKFKNFEIKWSESGGETQLPVEVSYKDLKIFLNQKGFGNENEVDMSVVCLVPRLANAAETFRCLEEANKKLEEFISILGNASEESGQRRLELDGLKIGLPIRGVFTGGFPCKIFECGGEGEGTEVSKKKKVKILPSKIFLQQASEALREIKREKKTSYLDAIEAKVTSCLEYFGSVEELGASEAESSENFEKREWNVSLERKEIQQLVDVMRERENKKKNAEIARLKAEFEEISKVTDEMKAASVDIERVMAEKDATIVQLMGNLEQLEEEMEGLKDQAQNLSNVANEGNHLISGKSSE